MLSLVLIALLFIVYGCSYLLFAFIEPPPAVSRFFKIPSIFIFLPDRYQARVGRIFSGLVLIAAPFIVAFKVVFWRP